MRIVIASDLHGRHKNLDVPDGDILIISGDLTPRGEINMLGSFIKWLKKQSHQHKIVIAGNHDWCFQNTHGPLARSMVSEAAHYLEDSFIDIDGIKFYGSPWQPAFNNWAFNLPRGSQLAKVWSLVPDDTDVLITHSPPFGVLDCVTGTTEHLGCEDLARAVFERIRPKLHIFGHIHSAYGECEVDGITFINASVLDEEYNMSYLPKVIDYAPVV